jgi:hypothetical protein
VDRVPHAFARHDVAIAAAEYSDRAAALLKLFSADKPRIDALRTRVNRPHYATCNSRIAGTDVAPTADAEPTTAQPRLL